MPRNLALPLAVIGVAAVLILFFVMSFIGVQNQAATLEAAAKAQQQVNSTVFDTCWKTIQGQAGVTDAYKDGFRQVYTDLMDARYGNDQQVMMKFLQESTPNFDSSLYKTVMNTIAEQRAILQQSQKRLISIQEQHNRLRATFPGSMILAGRPGIEIQIVTSAKTEAAFQSGEENDDPNPFAHPASTGQPKAQPMANSKRKAGAK